MKFKDQPLQTFRLRNFKAVRDSGMIKFTPLTVFIGNNGSGKSSVIEGLETFQTIVGDLENIYKEHGYPYSPLTDSLKIVRAMPDLSRLHSIPSFARFEKLMCNKDFHCQRHL